MVTRVSIAMSPDDAKALVEAMMLARLAAVMRGDPDERIDVSALIAKHCPSATYKEYQVPAGEMRDADINLEEWRSANRR